jgi:hypothetical protein
MTKVDALEDIALRGHSRSGHPRTAQSPRSTVQRRRVRHVLHLGAGVDQVEHRAHVDHALPDRAIDPPEHVERRNSWLSRVETKHDIAGRELVPVDQPQATTAITRAEHHIA